MLFDARLDDPSESVQTREPSIFGGKTRLDKIWLCQRHQRLANIALVSTSTPCTQPFQSVRKFVSTLPTKRQRTPLWMDESD